MCVRKIFMQDFLLKFSFSKKNVNFMYYNIMCNMCKVHVWFSHCMRIIYQRIRTYITASIKFRFYV